MKGTIRMIELRCIAGHIAGGTCYDATTPDATAKLVYLHHAPSLAGRSCDVCGAREWTLEANATEFTNGHVANVELQKRHYAEMKTYQPQRMKYRLHKVRN